MRSFTVFLLFCTIFGAFSHLHSHDEHEHSGFDALTQHFHELEEEHHHGHAHNHEHDHEHEHEHEDDHHHHKKSHKTTGKLSTLKTWVYSLSAVFGISLAPCFLLFFIPAQHANGPFLKILLAFGAGGLLGDALLHIIPHSLSPHDHSHGNEHGHAHAHESHEEGEGHDHSQQLRVGLWVIGGILVFMMVEQLVRIIKGGHCHSHENGHIVADEHRHLHDHAHLTHSDHSDINDQQEKDQEKPKELGLKDVKASAYLNLVADFVHNVTDGLAIGASFSAGSTLGWVTTLTVLLHELPHEVGDFAILVQSGFSKYKAIRMQVVTALGAITGCIFSLIVSEPGQLNSGAETSAIMPFTAGGFIYIATVSVIPELLESGDHNNMSKVAKMAQSVVHVLAICMGVGMMYIVSLVE